jgi:HlyD family secretion protein
MRKLIAILVLIVAATGGAFYFVQHKAVANPATSLRTTAVKRGDLLTTISATGTIEPEEVVNVGAQVAGLIVEFGPDPCDPAKTVDYGTVVEKDGILAQIDRTFYEAAMEQAEAALEQSEANLMQLQTKLRCAERDWNRAKSLMAQKAIADTDYDTALTSYESAVANEAVGKAMIRQNKATVKTAKVNLGYCTIKSPVRGTIIDRRVNIGQTVVASLNAPSLFLIAKDLSKMQVWASVNEADIGRIRMDMPVRFTVDAHEGCKFYGKVTQIRMNAQMTQNVVTYTVIVTTDNSDGKLLPYLTGNVQFEVDKKTNVLLAPNAALRWSPEAVQIDSMVEKSATLSDPDPATNRGRLWVVGQNGLLRPVDVTVGTSDGTMTEISGDDVKDGMKIVSGEEETGENAVPESTSDGDKTSNPFMPKLPKGARPPPGPM